MKKLFLFLVIGILTIGCSSSDDNSSSTVVTPFDLKLNIDGVPISYPNTSPIGSSYSVYKKGDKYTINATYGRFDNADSNFTLMLTFSSEGKFISGNMDFTSFTNGNPKYNNFIHFPSNYFQTTDFSVDEANAKIKFKFNGRLYMNNESLASDARNIQGEVDMTYIDGGDDPYPIVINNVEQYCRANINGVPWSARFERKKSSFTDEGAYKIETNFANSPSPGSYNFTSASTSNYVKFSKFNTTTLTYDYYNVTGQVAYSYREYHGYTYYSFIGTFSFTATNPNNPADVITVSDGVFRSYQEF